MAIQPGIDPVFRTASIQPRIDVPLYFMLIERFFFFRLFSERGNTPLKAKSPLGSPVWLCPENHVRRGRIALDRWGQRIFSTSRCYTSAWRVRGCPLPITALIGCPCNPLQPPCGPSIRPWPRLLSFPDSCVIQCASHRFADRGLPLNLTMEGDMTNGG